MLASLPIKENLNEGSVYSDNNDSSLQAQRRKMLRRAANRKSAQLSRARKKAHMEDLKAENSRLQKVVDILESQPELLFCITLDGRLTYIPERTLNFIRLALPNNFLNEDPTHISQILSIESVQTILQTITQLSEIDPADHEIISSVGAKEVYFTENCKFVGYLRCSKVIRAPENDETFSTSNQTDLSDLEHKSKKSKKVIKQITDDDIIVTDDNVVSIANAVAALSSLCQNKPIDTTFKENSIVSESKSFRRKSHSTHSEISESESHGIDNENIIEPPGETEFVCVIRSADVSLPKDSNLISSLSRASVEAHNMGQKSNRVVRYTAVSNNTDRPSSPNSSLSSSLKSLNSLNNNTSSESSNGLKNGTSSESSSDDCNVLN